MNCLKNKKQSQDQYSTSTSTWVDQNNSLIEEIEKIARRHSKDFIIELQCDPAVSKFATRSHKSAYADGFSCGIQWCLENPCAVIKMIIKNIKF